MSVTEALSLISSVVVALFTALLGVLTYIELEPVVVASPEGVQGFAKCGEARIMISFRNMGRSTAYSMVNGIAAGLLPYPLGDISLQSVEVSSHPADLLPNVPFARPVTISVLANDYEAVIDGSHFLLHVWGTIRFKEFWIVPRHVDFCFAYGGPTIKTINNPGICEITRAQQQYAKEQPQATPNPEPRTSPGPRAQ